MAFKKPVSPEELEKLFRDIGAICNATAFHPDNMRDADALLAIRNCVRSVVEIDHNHPVPDDAWPKQESEEVQ
jgi:hypothetical protein